MSNYFKTSVAALALVAVFGSDLAMAQSSTGSEAGNQPQAQMQTQPAPADDPAEVEIPEILQGPGFSDVTSREGPRGSTILQGSLTESGKDFDAMLNPEGELVAARTAEGTALPDELIESLLPEAVRNHPVTAEITELNAIGTREGSMMISGQDESGDALRIAFDDAGELIHFERGDGMRHGPKGEMRGDKGPKDGKRGERGKHGDGPRGDGPRDAERRGNAPRDPGRDGASAPDAGAAPSPEGALRDRLGEAGYTDLGRVNPQDDGATVEAVNPQGEPVTLTLDEDGEVTRETSR